MRIERYDFGHIVIEGQSYRSDVILLPDRVIPNWRREQGHSLSPYDLQDVVQAQEQVDTLIVGTGAYGMMDVPSETRCYLQEQGIQVIIRRTGSAVEEYNRRRVDQPVAAALHLTC
ncbi:MAG: MTH938/NDUFAF3 family protein [Chloroflexota bacterium]|nr:MTH938/NDUFAF3 family protein [Chloroflexota bacterium]